MTNTHPPTAGSNLTKAVLAEPRRFAAWGLTSYTGLYLVFAFFGWVLPDGGSFGARSAGAGFTALVELALPLIAVLLATGAGLTGAVPRARVIAGVALVEYAVAVVLGTLTWLIGLGSVGGHNARGAFDAMSYVLLGLGRIGLATLAGLVVYSAWVRLGGVLRLKVVRARSAPPAS
jgi:hypothetical protein